MSVNLFDTVTLTQEDADVLKAKYDDIAVMKAQINDLINLVNKQERNAWLYVRKLYPQFQDVEVRFDYDTRTIIVINLKP